MTRPPQQSTAACGCDPMGEGLDHHPWCGRYAPNAKPLPKCMTCWDTGYVQGIPQNVPCALCRQGAFFG